jgi:hypothetical protein
VRECNWTAFNFFRDPPDENFCDPNYVREKLGQDYYPIVGDPRYGDVVLIALPNGIVIHAAVFLADDVVYTKNGHANFKPWILSTIPELLKEYSYLAPLGKTLTVQFFRSKY